MIEQDLYFWLTHSAALVNLVGQSVFPVKLPEGRGDGVYPAVTFQKIAGYTPLNLDGPAGPARATFQVDCWSVVSEFEATDVAHALTQPNSQGGLHGFRGTMMPGGALVQKAAVDPGSERSEYSPPLHSDDIGLHRVGFDLVIVYEI